MANDHPLHEIVQVADQMKVDREAGVIRDVRLCARESANKRIYEDTALRDLARLYRLAPIRLGHGKTDYLSTVGSVTQSITAAGDGEVRGEISLNKGHPIFEQIMDDAEKRPHLLALSHEVPARKWEGERDKDGVLHVRRVFQVDCLAVVTDGGVNKGLFEEAEEMEIKTIADIKEHYPALYEEIAQSALDTAKENERLIEALQQRDHARSELEKVTSELTELKAQQEAAQKRAKIATRASALKVVCEDDLLEALMLLTDEAKIESILAKQPKLTEAAPETEDKEPTEKPKQRSGLVPRKTTGYVSATDRLAQRLAN